MVSAKGPPPSCVWSLTAFDVHDINTENKKTTLISIPCIPHH